MTNMLEERRASIERDSQNRARSAVANVKYDFTGAGPLEIEDSFDFGITFIEQPFVTSGCVVDLDEIRDLFDVDDDDTPPLPTVTAYVTDWEQDARDFYIGAYLAAVITWPDGTDPATAAQATVTVHYAFNAIALKDVPVDLRN